jgi:hypothetical protein
MRALLLAAILATAGAAEGWDADAALGLGGKWLPDLPHLELQGEGGLLTTLRPRGWPVGVAANAWTSGHHGTSHGMNGASNEAQLGIVRAWRIGGAWSVVAEGGVVAIQGKILHEPGGDEDMDWGVGPWLAGQVRRDLGRGWWAGVHLGWSYAEVELGGARRDAGGVHAAGLVGYAF